MKLKYTLLLLTFLSFGLLTSCDDDDEDEIEYTATYPISGDWTVTYAVETSPGEFEPVVEDTELLIYNTAENTPDAVWVDDHGNFRDFKVKTPVDISALTFGGENLQNVSHDSQVNIADGEVFLDAVEVNGLQRDSIFFRVSFSDEETPDEQPNPFGTTYVVYGHRSTGFE